MAIFMDDAPHVAGTVITITVLTYITYGMRVYTRVTRRSWGMEDWLMTVAMVPFTVLSIACLVASFNGVGIHQWRLDLPENAKYEELGLFWFFLFEVFYCVTIIPIKLSIGFMLVRIAEKQTIYAYSQYVIMALFTTMNLIAALYIIFQCNPVSAAWNTALQADHCQASYKLADIYYATTAVNIFTDWATALMPIPLLWNIQLTLNAKISVAAILGLGIFASLSACIRLKYTVNLTDSSEYLFGLANIVLWGYAENGIGAFVGNISTLRPLFRKILGLGGSDSSSGGATGPLSHRTPNGVPNGSAHPYKSFDTDYELSSRMGPGASHHNARHNKIHGSAMTSTQISSGGLRKTATGSSESISSDGDSQQLIIEQPQGGVLTRGPSFNQQQQQQQQQSSGGILVSRQVDIHHH